MELLKFGRKVATDGTRSTVLADGTVAHVTPQVGGVNGTWIQFHSADGVAMGPPVNAGLAGFPGSLFTIEIVAASDGGFFILAQSASGSPGGLVPDEVYLRKFDADGNAVSPFRKVNKGSDDDQRPAFVAADNKGGALVSFSDNQHGDKIYDPLLSDPGLRFNTDTRSWDVVIRRYDADNTPATPPKIVHRGTEKTNQGHEYNGLAGAQLTGQPAILKNGSVIVPYYDTGYAVRADGVVIKEDVVAVAVNGVSYTVWEPPVYGVNGDPFVWTSQLPQAVALSGGGFAVTWLLRVSTAGGVREQTFARIYDKKGVAVTDPFLVIDESQNAASGVKLAALKGGGFAVLYNDALALNDHDVMLVVVGSDGSLGTPVTVAGGTGNQIARSISTAADGSVHVTYSDGSDFFTQRFVLSGSGKTVETGTSGNDVVNRGGLKNWYDAEAGNDRVSLGGGNDVGYGGNGKDLLKGGTGNDRLFGGNGRDTLHGQNGKDLLEGGYGKDLLKGGTGNDRLFGGNGRDTLYGQHGNDLLDGGDGNDLINGGKGADTMTGGAGADVFEFRSGDARHTDRITDFDATEDSLRIFLDGADPSTVKVRDKGADTVIVLTADGNARIVLEDVQLTRAEIDFDFV